MNLEEIGLGYDENRYYNLLANISDVVVESDLKGNFLYVSPQCEQIFGYKPEFYIGKNGFIFIHPDDLQKIKDGMEQVLYGETIKLEFRVKKIDGSYLYVSASGNVIEIEGQKRFLAIIRDMSERRSMEEDLEASQYTLMVLNKINTAFLTVFDEEVYGTILMIILEALKSRYGVFGYINEKGDFICPSMTRDRWDECQIPDKTITFPRMSWGGIWGKAMLEGEIKYSNEPFVVPEGHIQIDNALDVPIMYDGKLIGNILVGNKETGYEENEIQLLESISKNISPILYNRLQKERKEQKLNESKHTIGERVKELTCLYEISKLVENPAISIRNIVNGTLKLIPPAWQFPSVTCARIIYDGLEFKTLNFKETEWKLDFQIQILDKILKIEVVYLKNRPFLREEYDLLRDIGARLKFVIERKEADKALEEKDLLARIFMENISGFVVLLRPSTREIIAMNKHAEEMGGIPGLTCYSTIGQSETPCPWCLAPKLWKTREAQHLVVDALDVTWDTYWDPISDDLYLHYGFDVTEQAQREKNLKELNQIKSQFLRRASHELKTPLVSIKGFTNLLLELKTEEIEIKTSSIVQEIKDGCLRLENLVNDIIYTSKLEDSQIRLSRSLENLSELIISAVNALKGFSQTRNQKILYELPEEMLTMVDKEGIQEVLTNLISNAIKYTPKNGSIKLKAKTSEGYFVIMIEDNGIGFTPEEEKKIFTQFGKIERYGQGFDVVSEGSGLGLYISKKILTQHRGSIWLESEGRNKGTTFFFSLPIIKE